MSLTLFQPLALVLLGMAMGFLLRAFTSQPKGSPMPMYPELQPALDALSLAVEGLPAKEQAKIDAAVAAALEAGAQDKADTISGVSASVQSATDALNNA